MKTLAATSFARAWRAGDLSDEPHAVHAGDESRALSLYCWSRPDATPLRAPLVVAFHGAIDRSKRSVPAFEGGPIRSTLHGRAVLVGIADPTLQLDPTLRLAWYAGHEGFDAPSAIAAVVKAMVDAWQPSRVVFVGGSTGGHPALLQSAQLAGSVAVVQNPITRISGYYRGTVEHYRGVCWPSLKPEEPLSSVTTDDVGAMYGVDRGNTVILLQNARDHHLFGQSAPFLQAVRGKRNRESLLYLSGDHPDHPGHSYPSTVWAGWVRAAVDAPATDRDAIAEAFRTTFEGAGESSRPTATARGAPKAADLASNARLLQETMREIR